MIKNIILTSAIDGENYKGMVTIENTSEKTLVNLKTYNLPKSENKRVLGVLIDGELYKVTLNNEDSYIIDKKTNLNNKISVVLLEIENNTSKILIWGSNETSRVWQNNVVFNFNLNENLNKNVDISKDNKPFVLENNDDISKQKNDFVINNFNLNNTFDKEEKENDKAKNFIKKVYAESKLDDDFESDEYIESLIDKNLSEEEFKESFINNEENSFGVYENDFIEEKDINKEVTEENLDNKTEFFKSVENQINELLNTYEEEKALEEIIPFSKFVKVDLENNGNFYIFGVIYENNSSDMKYIVYGIPGEFSVKPDDEYKNLYQWLPLNSCNPEGYGYYLMYQDAKQGNQIEMIIEEK